MVLALHRFRRPRQFVESRATILLHNQLTLEEHPCVTFWDNLRQMMQHGGVDITKDKERQRGCQPDEKGGWCLKGSPFNPQAPAIRVSKFMPPSKNIKCAAAWVEQNWVRTKEQRCELANIAFIIIITINNNISTWTTELAMVNHENYHSDANESSLWLSSALSFWSSETVFSGTKTQRCEPVRVDENQTDSFILHLSVILFNIFHEKVRFVFESNAYMKEVPNNLD